MKPEQLRNKMKGVVIVNTTPFNKDGSIDLGGFRANIRWLLEKCEGKDFILNPLGSTGEFYVMSDNECQAIMKATVAEVNGKLPVFVGAGRAGTQETIKMCQYAESVGVDGVQVILPYYFPPTEEGMYQHYNQIAANLKIAVMVYNNPGPTGSWIKPPLMARIAQVPNCIAVKENTSNLMSYIQMKKAVDPAGMAVLCGLGENMFSYEAVYGCPGLVSSNANAFPDWSYDVYQAAMAKDFDKVDSTLIAMNPFNAFIGKVSSRRPHTGLIGGAPIFISVVKAAMDIIGIRGGEVRMPLIGITPEEKNELAGIIRDMNLSWKGRMNDG